jgi:hypothetical protein
MMTSKDFQAMKVHPQMREVAEMIRAELLNISQVCFEDLS